MSEELDNIAFSPDSTLRDIGKSFTVERQKEMLRLISRGVSVNAACKIVGCGKNLYNVIKNEAREFINAVDSGNHPIVTPRIEACVAFFYNSEKAEAMFEATLDKELYTRISDMEDRDLIRLRDTRLNGINGNGHASRVNITNISTNGGNAHISFTSEELAQADNALLDAGIIEAEIEEGDDVERDS